MVVLSPTKPDPADFQRIEAFGPVRALVAPNHFHHLTLPNYRTRFPSAIVAASRTAIPRLTKQGHAGLVELSAIEPLLPEGAHWLEPEGTRSGEAWLSYVDGGRRTWLTGDAFMNVERPVTGLTGLFLQLIHVAPGFRIPRSFIGLAVRDGRRYRDWALAALEREQPTKLRVAHGGVVTGDDLPARLSELVVRAFPVAKRARRRASGSSRRPSAPSRGHLPDVGPIDRCASGPARLSRAPCVD